jgi:hypothetical protein
MPMTRQPSVWDAVAARALNELTDEERRTGVLYLDQRELPADAAIEVDKAPLPLRHRSALAFVDREPEVNWGHSCRYLLISLEGEEIQSIEAQFPPFLRGVPGTLRVIWKGEAVPEWAVAKP